MGSLSEVAEGSDGDTKLSGSGRSPLPLDEGPAADPSPGAEGGLGAFAEPEPEPEGPSVGAGFDGAAPVGTASVG